MPAPTYLPEVDNNGTNQPSDPAGIPQAVKDDGFVGSQIVPNTYWNWLFKVVNDWLQWGTSLFGIEHNTTTGAHTGINADSVTSINDVETTTGDVVATAGNASAFGSLISYRGVASGDPIVSGGRIANKPRQTGVGAGTTAESEGQAYDIPANTLATGTVVRVRVLCELHLAAPSTVIYRLRFGDPAAAITARVLLATWQPGTTIDGEMVELDVEFRVRGGGAILVMEGVFKGGIDQAGVAYLVDYRPDSVIGGEDGTAAIRVSPSVLFGTANAGNSVDFLYMTVEIL